MAGLAIQDDESFEECASQSIFEVGKAVRGYPIGKVLNACLWIKNASEALLKVSSVPRELSRYRVQSRKMRKKRSEHTRFSPPILLFSNSSECRNARHSHGESASDGATLVANSPLSVSDLAGSHTPGCAVPAPSWCEYQRGRYGKEKIRKRNAEPGPGKLCSQTALLFFVHSQHIKT